MRLLVTCAVVCAAALLVSVSGDAQGSGQRPSDLADRGRAAERVIEGTVTSLHAAFETNDSGDRLIITTAEVRVTDNMKGRADEILSVAIEGGSVGEVTLEVSDMPTLKPGARVVMFLEEQASGRYRPKGRGLGVLEFDADSRLTGTDMTLDEVKAAVLAGIR